MDALLVVDFQNDFCPGGALPVAEGNLIAGPINELLDSFDLVVATRDWHPIDHGSFVDVEVDPAVWEGTDPPSIWPVHCVQGTPGAELYPGLDREKLDFVLDKGMDRWTQGYSAFHRSGLAELLHEHRVDRVFVAGLTTEYCVKNTVIDARRLGLDVVVVEDAIRPVEVQPGDAEKAVAEMGAAGASFARSADVKRARAAA